MPARKEYAITDKGRAALHQWLVSPPELPELRHSFLIRLTWADPLTDDELDVLLVTYSEEIRVGCMVQREIMLRNTQPGRTQRETYLWRKISEHVVAIYQDELKWAEEICLDLKMMRQS